MASNLAELNLIKLARTPDPSSVKRLHFMLLDAEWLHQHNLIQVLNIIVQSSFPGIFHNESRRIVEALLDRCMRFSLDPNGSVFFKLRDDLKTPAGNYLFFSYVLLFN
jgi:hypothetical protein